MKILENLTYNKGMFVQAPILVNLFIGHYPNGRLAIHLESEIEDAPGVFEPFATCTVNLVGENCPSGEVWVKDWSENAGMTDWLADHDVIEPTVETAAETGYVSAGRHKLTDKFKQLMLDALVASGERSRR